MTERVMATAHSQAFKNETSTENENTTEPFAPTRAAYASLF